MSPGDDSCQYTGTLAQRLLHTRCSCGKRSVVSLPRNDGSGMYDHYCLQDMPRGKFGKLAPPAANEATKQLLARLGLH